MLSFLFRRIAATLPVLAIVALIVFLMTRLAPGDPAALLVGDSASLADIERVRVQLGLDRPLLCNSSSGRPPCCKATLASRCS